MINSLKPSDNLQTTCFIVNADLSILNLKLKHGFEFKEVLYKDGIELLKKLDGTEPLMASEKLRYYRTPILIDNFVHSFVNSNFIILERKDVITSDVPEKIEEPEINNHTHFVNNYIDNIIQLIRLFTECNIDIPIRYTYSKYSMFFNLFLIKEKNSINYLGKFLSLSNNEINALNVFLDENTGPISNKSLQLAFEHFEHSYGTININLSFLSLMISLEILFNPIDRNEIGKNIARGVAILTGEDKEESNNIYKEVKTLYGYRSKLIHGGKLVTSETMLKTRDYVRKSIKKMMAIDDTYLGNNLKKFKDTIEICGLGDRPWS